MVGGWRLLFWILFWDKLVLNQKTGYVVSPTVDLVCNDSKTKRQVTVLMLVVRVILTGVESTYGRDGCVK